MSIFGLPIDGEGHWLQDGKRARIASMQVSREVGLPKRRRS